MERTALISANDKSGLQELLEVLHDELKWNILATGNTYKYIIKELKLKDRVMETVSITGITGDKDAEVGDYYPGGLVKTLHPKIHAGLLYGIPEELEWMNNRGIIPINLLVCNLYPFEQAAAKPDATVASVVEDIDIGGPSMLRSAAKGALRHGNVVPACNPENYGLVIRDARQGYWSPFARMHLAERTFARTAQYDAAITEFLRTHPYVKGSMPEFKEASASR